MGTINSSGSAGDFWKSLNQIFDERRNSMRFCKEPGMDYATVLAPEDRAGMLEVYDESLGGLGLIVRDPQLFAVGETLEIAYAGAKLHGTVRHITSRGDGRYILGIGTE